MNPLLYHNALAAMVEAQKSALEDYERRLALMTQRAEQAEAALAQMHTKAEE